jgi:hypothetical protein
LKLVHPALFGTVGVLRCWRKQWITCIKCISTIVVGDVVLYCCSINLFIGVVNYFVQVVS